MAPRSPETTLEGYGLSASGLIIPGGEKPIPQKDQERIQSIAGSIDDSLERKRLEEQQRLMEKLTHQGDLVLPEGYDRPIALPQTQKPEKIGTVRVGDLENTTTGLVIPRDAGTIKVDSLKLEKPAEKTLAVATHDEALQLFDHTQEKALNATEIANVLFDPASHFERNLAKNKEFATRAEKPLYEYRALGVKGYEPTIETDLLDNTTHIHRVITTKTKTVNGESYEQTVSEPGGVELIGIELTKILSRDEFIYGATKKIGQEVDRFRELLNVYRRTEKTLLLPEMPDFTNNVIDLLGKGDLNNNLRNRLYDILNSVELPASQKEDLLVQMDKKRENGDLQHPLAFRMTLELAQDSPESPWQKMQTERREFLESKLTGSPQDILDHAKELRALAKGIVYAEDFDRIKPGKVGLELEFIEIGRAHSNGTVQYKGMPRLPDTWELGYDTAQLNNLEVRRTNSITALEFNTEYLQDLSELGIYMGMYAQGISSLHLHLDKNRHPEGKWLGEILTSYETKVGVREDTEHNTTEIRALLAPGAGYNLRVGSIANAIAMYIYASDSPLGCESAEQQMKMNGLESLEDVTLAHLAKYIANPTGRLAALKVIEDQTMFKALNPLALASGIRPEDRSQLVKAFQNIPLDEYHEGLVESLDRIASSTNAMTATQVELIMSDNRGDGMEYAIGAILRPFWRDKDLREVVNTLYRTSRTNQIFNLESPKMGPPTFIEENNIYMPAEWRPRTQRLRDELEPELKNKLQWNNNEKRWQKRSYKDPHIINWDDYTDLSDDRLLDEITEGTDTHTISNGSEPEQRELGEPRTPRRPPSSFREQLEQLFEEY